MGKNTQPIEHLFARQALQGKRVEPRRRRQQDAPVLDPGTVVIVTGPPGSGKTAVCDALARDERRSAHVESDWFFRFVRSGFVPPWQAESAEQNDHLMDIATDAVAAYAAAGYVVFWDGIVGPWYLERVLGRLLRHAIDPHYVVLRPGRDTALARVLARDGSADRTGAAVMYDQFCNLGPFERHVVDSEGPVEQVAGEVRRLLGASQLVLAGSRPPGQPR
jgi:adenylate kinase family enzyme